MPNFILHNSDQTVQPIELFPELPSGSNLPIQTPKISNKKTLI